MPTPKITGPDKRKYNRAPTLAERTPEVSERATDKLVNALLKSIANLIKIADGVETVVERWEAAGTITCEILIDNPGGRPIRSQKLLYPDLPPDQMVLVARTITNAGPDRASNQYLIDRVLGKPIEQVSLSTKAGGAVQITAADMLSAVAPLAPAAEIKAKTQKKAEKSDSSPESSSESEESSSSHSSDY